MPRFVIERNIPGAGKLRPDTLRRVSEKSCGVLQEMGPQTQWIHSYVSDDKIYCVYAERRSHPQACPGGRFSRRSDQRGPRRDRPDHGGRGPVARLADGLILRFVKTVASEGTSRREIPARSRFFHKLSRPVDMEG
jgi:hypothetical protein